MYCHHKTEIFRCDLLFGSKLHLFKISESIWVLQPQVIIQNKDMKGVREIKDNKQLINIHRQTNRGMNGLKSDF